MIKKELDILVVLYVQNDAKHVQVRRDQVKYHMDHAEAVIFSLMLPGLVVMDSMGSDYD